MMHGSLALKLRVLRAEKALTIEQAARRAGVTPETISDAERGRRHPYLPTLRKLARAYEVPVEELVAKEADEPEAAPAGGSPKEEARATGQPEAAASAPAKTTGLNEAERIDKIRELEEAVRGSLELCDARREYLEEAATRSQGNLKPGAGISPELMELANFANLVMFAYQGIQVLTEQTPYKEAERGTAEEQAALQQLRSAAYGVLRVSLVANATAESLGMSQRPALRVVPGGLAAG